MNFQRSTKNEDEGDERVRKIFQHSVWFLVRSVTIRTV